MKLALLETGKSVQSTLSHLQSPLNEYSPRAIMAHSCESDIFMTRFYKQTLPKIAQQVIDNA